MKKKNNNIAKLLMRIWWVSYFVVHLVFSIISNIETSQPGESLLLPIGNLWYISLAFVLLFFYPMLFLIRNLARKENHIRLKKVTDFLLIIHTLWIVAAVIITGLEALSC